MTHAQAGLVAAENEALKQAEVAGKLAQEKLREAEQQAGQQRLEVESKAGEAQVGPQLNSVYVIN